LHKEACHSDEKEEADEITAKPLPAHVKHGKASGSEMAKLLRGRNSFLKMASKGKGLIKLFAFALMLKARLQRLQALRCLGVLNGHCAM
jgi:hypothetical protein